jgi:sigma-B regulation protein RsbU (phosphoserine phosphatase)
MAMVPAVLMQRHPLPSGRGSDRSHEVPVIFQGVFAALVRELETLRRRDQVQRAALQQLQDQMRSAAELQRDLLPSRVPTIGGLQVDTLYRPAETVSGDFYDIVRLDDHRVAFTLADATGHGLPAGMLSALTRRSLRARNGSAFPDEVLAAANREVLSLGLSECQFVAALHAVYDEFARTLSWARGGLPYPIVVRDGEAPRQVSSAGPALGTVQDASFEVVTMTLQHGDRIIFHTDGLDCLLAERPGGDLPTSLWFAEVARSELQSQINRLDARLAQARSAAHHIDDVTVIALQAI